MTDSPPRALEGLRVLDLGGALSNYCTKLFAELGADVVLIEPPAGNDHRNEPPFAEDGSGGSTASLPFFYRNTSKRAIVVDVDQASGVELVRRLASTADLVVEDHPPGHLDAKGLGADRLLQDNPALVVTSITPFGQDGPYAQFQHADLVCLAFGGLLWMGGYADGPPVRVVGDQAYMAGSLFGAVGSMTALTHAELQGQGQHVDVSVQEAVVMGLENAAQFYDLEHHIRRRFGGTQRQAGFGVFPCADGHVFLFAGGISGTRFWGNLVDWMRDDGVEGVDALDGDQWGDREFLATIEAKELLWGCFTSFAQDKSKLELYHASQKWRVPLGPINLPSDVHASAQLQHRGFFVDVEAFGRSVAIAGAPYRLSETPWQLTGPAPALGEHTDEVLTELGLTTTEIDGLREQGAIR